MQQCRLCGSTRYYSGGCNGEWHCYGDNCPNSEDYEPSGASLTVGLDRDIKDLHEKKEKLMDEVNERKKQFERRKAQVVSMSDQYWESAKDRVEDLEVIRDKMIRHEDLSPDDLGEIFMVLNLVIAEARLRQVLTPRS